MTTATILIVEDESIIALDIKHSLEAAGYSVVGLATFAAEAIEQTATLNPDLVLMDIRLDGEPDGVEAAQQIRDRFQRPVVYLTAHADELTLQRAKATEPFGYVLKPFDDRDLITTIEIALSRYHAEEAIRTALEKEKEFNELKSRFVSMISHEFRNPLNAILFSSELLEQFGAQFTKEKQQLYLQRIQASVRHMSQLLNDVLTVGEVEAGSLQYRPGPLDLSTFCRDLIEDLQMVTNGHQIRLSEEWGTCSAPRPANDRTSSQVLPCLDEKLLRHILTNLLSNAIKYSPQGGNINLNLICHDDSITFEVQDQGIGIPTCDQARLFDSFYRATNVQAIPGTGLGLSIVKQCVDLHGGQILFTSDAGVGTTFTVTLPLRGWQVTNDEDFSH